MVSDGREGWREERLLTVVNVVGFTMIRGPEVRRLKRIIMNWFLQTINRWNLPGIDRMFRRSLPLKHDLQSVKSTEESNIFFEEKLERHSHSHGRKLSWPNGALPLEQEMHCCQRTERDSWEIYLCRRHRGFSESIESNLRLRIRWEFWTWSFSRIWLVDRSFRLVNVLAALRSSTKETMSTSFPESSCVTFLKVKILGSSYSGCVPAMTLALLEARKS